jgi:hypothetical protein
VLRRIVWWAVSVAALGCAAPARAVPSFAEQTGQPCAACHVGAFGPQLKQFGREFKLGGYTADDGSRHFPPVAVAGWASFTHVQDTPQGAPVPHFASNDNFALDQVSLFYAGEITKHYGIFLQITYDGVADQLQFDTIDLRYSREKHFFGIDTIYGFTLNNNPTVSDVWNSVPAWGFPYNNSALAPSPQAATLIDGGLAGAVGGLGAYALWGDWLYTEFDLYHGLSRGFRNALGIVPVADTPSLPGVAPYWRVALQHDTRRFMWEVGTYGIDAYLDPLGPAPVGALDHYTDAAADANIQYLFNPRSVVSDMLSFHATLIDESSELHASSALLGTRPHDWLQTARADLSYSIGATWTPTVQVFTTNGSADPGLFQGPSARPDSAGYVLELAYAPFGKPGSPIQWGNLRLALQYIGYTRFDGQTHGASRNNTLYPNLWFAWHF